jgi:hypothetical protein
MAKFIQKAEESMERRGTGLLSWPYIAGFFDGEGNISLGRQKRCGDDAYSRGALRIHITQAGDRGKRLLDEIAVFLRDAGITARTGVHFKGDDKHQRSYRLRIDGFRGCIPFLTALFPYLHIKKLEAQDVLRYNRLFPTLVGRGHSHTENTLKAWETRRRLYGSIGRKPVIGEVA